MKCLNSKAPSRGGPEHKETHTPQTQKLVNYKCTWYCDNSRCLGDILEISLEERRVLNSQDHDSRSGGRVAPAGGSVCQLRDTTSVQSILIHTHKHTQTQTHTHTHTSKPTHSHKHKHRHTKQTHSNGSSYKYKNTKKDGNSVSHGRPNWHPRHRTESIPYPAPKNQYNRITPWKKRHHWGALYWLVNDSLCWVFHVKRR